MIIAVPTIMTDFLLRLALSIWLVMGYMLTMTLLVPAFGKLSDMIGRKQIFVGGFAVFAAGSLLCAICTDGVQLLVFRIIQATGGSMIVANSTGIAASVFPQEQTGRVMGVSSMLTGVGSILGPIVGGLLTGIGWRTIFYINIPIGIFGAIYAAKSIREAPRKAERKKFDVKGMLLFSGALLLLLLSITIAGFKDRADGAVWGLGVGAGILVWLFVRTEKRQADPFIDLNMLKPRPLRLAYLSCLANSLAIGACAFLMIFYYQGIKSYSPAVAGLYIMPMFLPILFVSPLCGKLSDRFGSRKISGVALSISALGAYLMLKLEANTPELMVGLWLLVIGLGGGMFFAPNSRAVLRMVNPAQRGIASGIRVMTANVGNVLSIAISMAVLAVHLTPTELTALFVEKKIGSRSVSADSFMSALHLIFLISCALSVTGALLTFLRKPAPSDKIPTQEKQESETQEIAQDNEPIV